MSRLIFFRREGIVRIVRAARDVVRRLREKPQDPSLRFVVPRYLPNDVPMPEHSTSTEEEKRVFYEGGMTACVRCSSEALRQFSYGCGGRSNGDGYGYDRFACAGCEYVVDFAYDEDGGVYYYETSRWDQTAYRCAKRS
jgi:hypothetical protein